MRIKTRATGLTAALAIAFLLVAAAALGPQRAVEAAGQASGGPTKVVTCTSPRNDNAATPSSPGAPSTGPDTATAASNDRAENPLWCVSGISGGNAPAVTPSANCGGGGGTAGGATIDSSTRGFDWVC
jgi:hypothetical protein